VPLSMGAKGLVRLLVSPVVVDAGLKSSIPRGHINTRSEKEAIFARMGSVDGIVGGAAVNEKCRVTRQNSLIGHKPPSDRCLQMLNRTRIDRGSGMNVCGTWGFGEPGTFGRGLVFWTGKLFTRRLFGGEGKREPPVGDILNVERRLLPAIFKEHDNLDWLVSLQWFVESSVNRGDPRAFADRYSISALSQSPYTDECQSPGSGSEPEFHGFPKWLRLIVAIATLGAFGLLALLGAKFLGKRLDGAGIPPAVLL
jgi:hypothetical protein